MARSKESRRSQKRLKQEPEAGAPAEALSHRLPLLGLALAVVLFYGTPLTSPQTSIQWDAVDVHYTFQKYFSDHVRQGVFPHWTPYVFAGYPFLSDPQVGAWYPLNWPFFLFGITPRSIEWELALHALIAAVGAYLAGWQILRDRCAATLAAVFFAFSGFFAAHSSHVGMYQTASWLPWLIWILLRAIANPSPLWPLLAGLVTGMLILAGHFQTALYTGWALGCAALALVAAGQASARRVALTLGTAAAVGLLIAAIMIVPGLELTGLSIRSTVRFDRATNSPLVPSALGTLVLPNALGALEGAYHGPEDITQYYFYGGILLLPLVAVGLRKFREQAVACALIVPALWYALGPEAGLHRVLSWLPGLRHVRAPVHIWFVVALGLALLAGSGFVIARERLKLRAAAWLIPLVVFGDVVYWNSASNPLAYSRSSYNALYGDKLTEFEARIGSKLAPLDRFHAPYALPAFGPQNHLMHARVSGTYGYSPLALLAYSEYFQAAAKTPKLIHALGVRARLDLGQRGVVAETSALPRVTFARQVRVTHDARRELETLDPAETVLSPVPVPAHDAAATAQVTQHGEGWYRIRYRAAGPSLLRVAEAYYPGWHASVNGAPASIHPVDHALTGVLVPKGEGEIVLRYDTRGFWPLLTVSLVTLLMAAAGIGWLLWRRDGKGALVA
ncbi:MAG: YfhO family protein [Bryobacteraceae bacterium]